MNFDLENLESLICEPHAGSFEISPLNRYHGAGATLREFAGIPVEEPLAMGIEHYIPFDLSLPHQADFSVELPVYLATTRQRARVYRKEGMPKVYSAGFAYFYSRENYRLRYGLDAGVDRKGTVVFPHKSTAHRDRDFDRENLVQQLMDLPDEFHPLTICLYWRDVERGMADVYRSAGFKVVTCGHFLHPDFLLRFHDLCRMHRFSCANTIATSMPLSILSGCRFFYLNTGKLKTGSTVFEKDPFLEPPLARKAMRLSSLKKPVRESIQKKFAEKLAGKRWVQSAQWIRRRNEEAMLRLVHQQTENQIWSPPRIADQSAGLSRYLPKHVDWDGWAGRAGEIRFRDIIGKSAEVRLMFPPDRGFESLTLNGHEITPGFHRVSVPLDPGRSGTRLIWEAKGEGEKLSEADPRIRAFRFCSLGFGDPVDGVESVVCSEGERDACFLRN